MSRAVMLVAMFASSASFAQTKNPDEEWNTLPAESKPQPAAAPSDVPPVPAPPPVDTRTNRPYTGITSPRPVLEPNTVSMFGGRSLGFLNRGEMFYLGFPLLGIRFSLGLAERFDIGLGYDSFYFIGMNEPMITARANFFRGSNWSMAAVLEGSWAFFSTRASVDLRGPRWLTGRRNFNIRPGITFSYQGDHPRAARLFMTLMYMLTFDTEPYQRDPLGGVPASVQLGHNAMIRAGAEMPLTAKTSFVFLLGLDVHGRYDLDAPVMPVCSVGLVTSI